MPSFHLHTCNDAEQIHIGKLLELITAQGASKETAQYIKIQENYLLSQWHFRGPDSSLCHKAYQKHKHAKLYFNLGPHKNCSNMQATTQYVSPEYEEVPQ